MTRFRVGIGVLFSLRRLPAATYVTEQRDSTKITSGLLGYGPQWEEFRLAAVNQLADAFGIADSAAPKVRRGGDQHWPMMVLAGLTSVADWVGSNRPCFEHEPLTNNLRQYVSLAESRAADALAQLGWLGWNPSDSAAKSFTCSKPSR